MTWFFVITLIVTVPLTIYWSRIEKKYGGLHRTRGLEEYRVKEEHAGEQVMHFLPVAIYASICLLISIDF